MSNNYSEWVKYLPNPLVLIGFVVMLVFAIVTALLLKVRSIQTDKTLRNRIIAYICVLSFVVIIGAFYYAFTKDTGIQKTPQPVVSNVVSSVKKPIEHPAQRAKPPKSTPQTVQNITVVTTTGNQSPAGVGNQTIIYNNNGNK